MAASDSDSDLRSDEELAREARAGSLPAFELLVRRYQRPLLHFLQKRHTRDAEDVFQETMLKVYRSMDRYDDRRPFKTWVFTLAYRQAISSARKLRLANGGDAGLQAVTDDQAGPAALAERNELHGKLWDLARRILSDEQFSALWLVYAESLPPRQAAVVLGRSWLWVRTNLHRSRKLLLAAMAPDIPPLPAELIVAEASS